MKNVTIPEFAKDCADRTRKRLDTLAKLPGSLGKLEELSIRLAGITARECPSFPNKGLVLFAADHDIVLKGASASSQEMTELQVRNFCRGGGAINAFCRTANACFTIVDVGMKRDVDIPGLVQRKVVHGARDFSTDPAMTRDEALSCLQVGIDMAREQAARGINLLAPGEMGIGNTSPSAAIISVLADMPLESVTGMGAYMSSDRLRKKTELIRHGIEVNQPDPSDPLDVLAKVGGPEIAAMAGFMLGGVSLRIPVVLDGLIATAAALVAEKLFPGTASMLTGSHVSAVPGHAALMERLGIPTYLDLGMRLGEGTGAVLLFPVIDTAVRILTEMPTLDSLDFS